MQARNEKCIMFLYDSNLSKHFCLKSTMIYYSFSNAIVILETDNKSNLKIVHFHRIFDWFFVENCAEILIDSIRWI